MKKLLPLAAVSVIGLMVLVAAFAFFGGAEQPDEKTTDMIAGQKTDAGDIFVWNDDEYFYVKYVAGDGWAITETHLHIGEDSNDFPTSGKGKNLVPGKFAFKGEHDYVGEVEYKIDLSEYDITDGMVYIAAHAVVVEILECESCDCEDCFVDIDAFADSLPETATISVTYGWGDNYNPPASPSYFDPLSVLDTDLEGDYEGWCIDIGRGEASDITQSDQLDSKVFSSYEDLPSWLADVLDNEENLPMINWLLNQDLVGEPYDDDEVYTMGDVQRAIWYLIDDDEPQVPSALVPFSEERAAALVELAEEHDDFVPGCGDKIGVIFAPFAYDEEGNIMVSNQVTLIMVDLPCYCYGDSETAWGDGERFTKKGNWAMTFTYELEWE